MRRPWIRFLLLGVALFVGHEAWTHTVPASPLAGPEPGVPLDDEALLFRVALARELYEDDPVVRLRLAQNLRFALGDAQASDAELVEQALALGMHETDRVVRRRLVQKMTLLLEAPASDREPSDAELEDWRRAHAVRWQRPARRDLTQVSFAREADARAALAAGVEGTAAGDPLPVPRDLARHDRRALARLLGAGFAEAVFRAPIGRWSGPIRSAYGWHLVFVRAQEDGGPAPLRAVRAQVRGQWLEARRAEARRAGVAALRARWSVPTPEAPG